MIRTYKRKLILTVAQEKRLNSWIGAARLVYNLGLEIKIEAYRKSRKSVNRFDLLSQLKGLREDVDWIRDVPQHSLKLIIDRLDKSYVSFFKNRKSGTGLPRFANKKSFTSIPFMEGTRCRGNRIKVRKIGWLAELNRVITVEEQIELGWIRLIEKS